MMLVPSLFGENLFDDWFGFPDFKDFDKTERKLYGHNAARLMKTDVHENDGNLTVTAAKGLDEDDKTEKGKLIRQERYAGSMQRSFFVGHGVKEEDVKARFEHGVLTLTVPKTDAQKVPEKKTIMIEG